MRFDSHRVSAYLVEAMHRSQPRLEVVIDDGDIIHTRTQAGETAALYMIEAPISAADIRFLVETNTSAGIHSLFVLWAELLMPAHNTHYSPHDWMSALLALHGDRIYAFDPYSGDHPVFPVHFDREAGRYARRIRHGAPIDPAALYCHHVRVSSPGFSGTWRVADFGAAGTPLWLPAPGDLLAQDLLALGIERRAAPELTRALVKRAYRRLARQHHPDVSDSPDAAETMRRLNEAYARVLQSLDNGRL